MMIPLWVLVLVVDVLLVIGAGVIGWVTFPDDRGSWFGADWKPLGCVVCAVPVALLVAIVMAVWGWMR